MSSYEIEVFVDKWFDEGSKCFGPGEMRRRQVGLNGIIYFEPEQNGQYTRVSQRGIFDNVDNTK